MTTKVAATMQTVQPSLAATMDVHVSKWSHCCRCQLAANTEHHVLFRGSVPADILFIGEAPGTTEDMCGVPFVGRSGKLLTKMLTSLRVEYRFAITNTVACIPLTEEGQIRPPDKSEVATCFPRVTEFYSLVKPKAVVYVGKVASKIDAQLCKHFPDFNSTVKRITIYHPAYLLRKGGDSPNNVEYKRTFLILQKFVKQVLK